jgi:hypothetical protein
MWAAAAVENTAVERRVQCCRVYSCSGCSALPAGSWLGRYCQSLNLRPARSGVCGIGLSWLLWGHLLGLRAAGAFPPRPEHAAPRRRAARGLCNAGSGSRRACVEGQARGTSRAAPKNQPLPVQTRQTGGVHAQPPQHTSARHVLSTAFTACVTHAIMLRCRRGSTALNGQCGSILSMLRRAGRCVCVCVASISTVR